MVQSYTINRGHPLHCTRGTGGRRRKKKQNTQQTLIVLLSETQRKNTRITSMRNMERRRSEEGEATTGAHSKLTRAISQHRGTQVLHCIKRRNEKRSREAFFNTLLPHKSGTRESTYIRPATTLTLFHLCVSNLVCRSNMNNNNEGSRVCNNSQEENENKV